MVQAMPLWAVFYLSWWLARAYLSVCVLQTMLRMLSSSSQAARSHQRLMASAGADGCRCPSFPDSF